MRDELPEPALAVLRVTHVSRQVVRQVRDRAGERVAERDEQPDEHQQREHAHDAHRVPAPLHHVLLYHEHDRVEYQREEPGHENQQEDVPKPVDQLAREEEEGDGQDGGDDRPQRHPAQVGGGPQPAEAVTRLPAAAFAALTPAHLAVPLLALVALSHSPPRAWEHYRSSARAASPAGTSGPAGTSTAAARFGSGRALRLAGRLTCQTRHCRALPLTHVYSMSASPST